MNLLLIEDEAGSSDLLVERLAGCGFWTTRVRSCDEALQSAGSQRAKAIVVDQTHGNTAAAASIKSLRENGIVQPVLVLSPRGDWRDKVEALDAGADDYAIKPVRSEEVAARLRAVIRRSAGQSSDRILLGGLDLDLKGQCAWLHGRCLNLTRNEFRLLRALMLADSKPVSREEISAALSPRATGLSDNGVEVQVARLRRKVGSEVIRTVRGIGYRIAVPNEPDASDGLRSACARTDGCCDNDEPED